MARIHSWKNKLRCMKSLNKILGFFNRSLRRKLILLTCLLFLIPFTLFGLITYQRAETMIENNLTSLALQNIMLTSQHIDLYMSEVHALSKTYCNDPSFVDMIAAFNDKHPRTEKECQAIVRGNRNYAHVSQSIRDAAAKVTNTFFINDKAIYNIHPAGVYFESEKPHPSEEWYGAWQNDSEDSFLSFVLDGRGMVMANPVISLSTRRSVYGTLLFELNENNLMKRITTDTQKRYPDTKLFVIDRFNSLVFTDSPMPDPVLHDLLSGIERQQGHYTDKVGGESAYIIHYTSPVTGFKIIHAIPTQSVLKEFLLLKNFIIILTAVTLPVIFILLSALASFLLKPVHQLVGAMSNIRKENFSTRVQIHSQDETKLLADSFNDMAEDIEDLINKVYVSRLQQKEAQILALQSQINPHFLYNTLDSIWGACLAGGHSDIASMIKSLSMIFKYNTNPLPSVCLIEEIRHIQNYMKIQNFRYENRYAVKLHIPDELTQSRIPRLTIQPLVENSIKYIPHKGISQGEVTITASLMDGMITMIVADNGKGLDNKKIEMLNHLLALEWRQLNLNQESHADARRGTGVGIKNVNARIKLLFGESFGLRFLPSEEGARVEVKIPYLKEDAIELENSGC